MFRAAMCWVALPGAALPVASGVAEGSVDGAGAEGMAIALFDGPTLIGDDAGADAGGG